MSDQDRKQLFTSEELEIPVEKKRPAQVRKTPTVPRQVKKPAAKKMTKAAVRDRKSLIRYGIAFSAVIVISLTVGLVLRFSNPSYDRYIASDSQTNLQFVRSFTTSIPEQAMLLDTFSDLPDTGHTVFEIPYGASISRICSDLAELGLLGSHSSQELLDLLVANGFDTSIRSGTLLIPEGLDLQTIGLILYKGFSDLAVVSFYDGMTLRGIDSYLSGRGIIESGEFLSSADLMASRYGLGFPEGYCLPETYVLPVAEGAASLIAEVMMLSTIDMINEHADRADFLGQTNDEIIIIASMIQRETATREQMPLISGIIYNRLACNMPLGIDATTRYETDNWSRPITAAELKADTPYNTRIKAGLPPTGIGNAGTQAILAALYPDDTPYFYYLHDRDGAIHPAVTYGEHLENIEKYLR